MTAFCYSTDEEEFYGFETSREIALACVIDDFSPEPGSKVWTAECSVASPASRHIGSSGYRLIMDMRDNTCDDFGEGASDWLADVSDEQVKELNAAIAAAVDAWATKHDLHPKFYSVENVEEHTVTG